MDQKVTMKPITKAVTVQEHITPVTAKDYLAKNKRNRPIRDAVVTLYSLDMKNHNWLFNHQGIAFNERGELVDGQHRLAAIIKSGETVLMNVTTGLRDEQRNGVLVNVMDTVDRGRIRNVGQQLGLFHGIPNGNRVTGTLNAVCAFFFGQRQTSLTTPQVLHVLEIYGKDLNAIYSLPDAGSKLPSFIGAPIVIFHNAHPSLAMAFTEQLLTLEGLKAHSPVMALIKWRDNHPHARSIRAQTMMVVASCLYHHKHGNLIKKVYASNEASTWLLGLQKSNERQLRNILGIADKAS